MTPTTPDVASGDGATGESHDSHVTTVIAQPPSPSKVEPTEQQSADTLVAGLRGKVSSLQEALDLSESQTQLINVEYKRLLAEKEVCMYVCMYVYVCMWLMG